MLKSRREVTVNMEFVYVVLHLSVALKIGKVYEREIFFIEKMNQFPFESYINISGNERK